ncbi:MAG: hypothetical protein SFU57_00130 [Gemmatimonadales bacterium]|nr:hypothetical protein [Gemmatimonadales bacterium]
MPAPALNPLDLTRLFHMMSAVAPLSDPVTPRMLGDMIPYQDGPALFQNCLAASLTIPLDDRTQRIPFLQQVEDCIDLHKPEEWSLRAVVCHAALVQLEELTIGRRKCQTSIVQTIARLLPIREQFLAGGCDLIGSPRRLRRITEHRM